MGAGGRLSVALQGGGSFGAFTWGILDRLLEEPNLSFDAVSGASAGALNAIVLASGLRRGGNEEAKRHLHPFWKQASSAPPSAEAAAASRPQPVSSLPINSIRST